MIDHRTAQRLRELRKKPEHLTPDGAGNLVQAELLARGLATVATGRGDDGTPSARLVISPDGEKALADIWRDSIAFVRAVAESALAVYGAGAVVWHAVKRFFM